MTLRALSDLDRPLRPGLAPGAWLHFDIENGATAAMLIGALLDLGIEDRVIRESLDACGLGEARYHKSESARAGQRGVLYGYDALLPQKPRRGPQPQPPRKRQLTTTMMQRQAAQEKKLELGKSAEKPKPKAKNAADDWLLGERASAQAMFSWLQAQPLMPLQKAISYKAARRYFETLAASRGVALHEIYTSGEQALQILADIIAFGAAMAALTPARVTASRVALREVEGPFMLAPLPGPGPWLLAILQGVPSTDAGAGATTPLAAALLWAICHRFGPRGAFTPGRQGVGLGARKVRSFANLVVASYGELPHVKTREGTPQRLAARLCKAKVSADMGGELFRLGAYLFADSGGVMEIVARAEHDDGVVALLQKHGAKEVLVSDIEVRVVGSRETTIAIVGPHGQASVLVVSYETEAGESFCESRNVEEAARKTGLSMTEVERAVYRAWSER